jgi:hypothetical protein
VTRHLLVIGAQRCGTTYLHDQLAAHPQIAMARPQRPEPKVFLSDELAGRGREWYRETFFAHARDELLLGEKSTSYLEYPEAAVRAADVLGDPLVLVQLRDPVERAMSHWAFSTDGGLETRSLADALGENLEGPLPWDPARTSVSPFAYLERGRYVEYLGPWLDRFGGDVGVLFLEETLGDPDALGALYAGLGVDAGFRPPTPDDAVNESHEDKPALDDDLLVRLREHFRDSDRALSQLLGRPLPWADEESTMKEDEQ